MRILEISHNDDLGCFEVRWFITRHITASHVAYALGSALGDAVATGVSNGGVDAADARGLTEEMLGIMREHAASVIDDVLVNGFDLVEE